MSVKTYQTYIKRPLDILCAAVMLIVMLIPMLIIAIAMKIDSSGPVLFRQQRCGYRQKPFFIFKFRTMATSAPSCATSELHDSPKYVTRIGSFLRRTSLDELPQLINIIKGEMSFIGPRPVVLSETELIKTRNRLGVYSIKPGITGWAQVNGRDTVGPHEKARLDAEYKNNLSLTTDIKCFLLTIQALLTRNGYREGNEAPHSAAPSQKILFTSHTANFAKFNLPFMRWFRDQGYSVHYASASDEVVGDCDIHHILPVSRSPFDPRNIVAIVKLKKIIDRENYDIIHTHTPVGGIITRLAARNARRKGTRVIYTAHGFHFFNGAPKLNWILYYTIEKIMARFTDIIITLNEDDLDVARDNFNTEVRYVPGVGVDASQFAVTFDDNQKEIAREQLGIKKDDIVLIYVAELLKRKRQIWLLHALASVLRANPSITLLLVGQDSMGGKTQRQARALGIEKQVQFLGYRNDIPSLMALSDIALSSSSQEGLPVNIIESMFAGLPVVATSCRGNRDLVHDNTTGYLVNAHNATGFASKVMRLVNDPALRKTMGQEARRRVLPYELSFIIKIMSSLYSHELSLRSLPPKPRRISRFFQLSTQFKGAGK